MFEKFMRPWVTWVAHFSMPVLIKSLHCSSRGGLMPFSHNWHNRLAFQLVSFWVINWQQQKWALFLTSYYSPLPPVFSSVIYFSHRISVQIKILIKRKLIGALKNLVVDTFQTPSAIFGRPSSHFEFEGGAALQAVSEWPWRR